MQKAVSVFVLVRVRAPIGIEGAKTAVGIEDGRPAFLDRVIFAVPGRILRAGVGDRAPPRIPLQTGMADAWRKKHND